MLMQTNSYIVPKDRRPEHARLLRRFRQTLQRLGCDHFEVYEQVGQNWSAGETTSRFVQIMRFRDRKHQQAVQAAERSDPSAQQLIAEFCELINFPYQQQQGLFAVGFYTSFMKMPSLPQNAALAGAPEAAPAAEAEPQPAVDEPSETAEAAPQDLLESAERDNAAVDVPTVEDLPMGDETPQAEEQEVSEPLSGAREEEEVARGGNGMQEAHEAEAIDTNEEDHAGDEPPAGDELLTPLDPIEEAPEATLDEESSSEHESFQRRMKH